MATKYRVEVEFDLETTIEPEGIERQFDNGNVDYEDFEDNSYFSANEVEASGGSIVFVVEAEDEDAAHSMAEEVIFDGQEYEDDNGFTWVTSRVNYSIESIEWEPTVDEAIEVLKDFVQSHIDEGSESGEGRVAKAAQVVLDDHSRLAQRVTSLEGRVADLDARITQLSERLQQEAFAKEDPQF